MLWIGRDRLDHLRICWSLILRQVVLLLFLEKSKFRLCFGRFDRSAVDFLVLLKHLLNLMLLILNKCISCLHLFLLQHHFVLSLSLSNLVIVLSVKFGLYFHNCLGIDIWITPILRRLLRFRNRYFRQILKFTLNGLSLRY